MSISRRSFIKGMGIGCVGCTVGSLPPGALALNPVTSLKGQSKLTPSLCEMCSYRCPIEAQVVNNKTVFIQGNRNSPHQKTRVCARGGSGVSLIYDPKRIVKPMKRKGPRGAGEWEVISWEQAYTEIAEKMASIKQHYGAESIFFLIKIRLSLLSFISFSGGIWVTKHLYACINLSCGQSHCCIGNDGW